MRRPGDDLSAPRAEPLPACERELADYLREVAREPHRHHFFQVLRRIEALTPHAPPLGTALRPAQEVVRIGQIPSLAFAPAPIAALEYDAASDTADDTNARRANRPARLSQYFFGFLGPNGPLPLHLTEFARERLVQEHDPSFARFLDVLLHRYALLFYRAQAQAQPAASLDRGGDSRFAAFVGALFGLAHPSCRSRDAAHDHLKLRHAVHFGRESRPLEGLHAILVAALRVPLHIEPFVCERLAIAPEERFTLGAAQGLGAGTVLGAHALARQYRFRVIAGPLTLTDAESLLPGGTRLPVMTALVRQYLNRELAWDLRLVFKPGEVPPLLLGRRARLGWTTFLNAGPGAHGEARAAAVYGPLLDADARVPLPGAS
ncbi:type VI secretion system baseplate subunit TssG [Caballeronia sp. BR00000012568055]|uniref:type VI secretion system baseplate subunit TssG n=1 Tax=Caballeronia sp. BR00000012568055 TaxID=2918761 RepID=UPI0023FA0FC7|nr:type VI secretion system baseplate subunit TssG [Caballeronia sp. BR00000012568055]